MTQNSYIFHFYFKQWLNIFITSTKGIKIQLQSTEVVVPALLVLKGMKGQLKQPIFLHSDLFVGPNMPAGTAIVDPVTFKVITTPDTIHQW